MGYDLPDRVLRELFFMLESIPSQELYYLVPMHEVLTPKEAISILQYTVEILTVFIGM